MRKVFWNQLAQADYFQIIDYLLINWGESSAQDFVDKVENIELILKSGKVDFEITDRKSIRRCVVTKQVTLFYKTNKNHSVELLRFWNNYQDMKDLKL